MASYDVFNPDVQQVGIPTFSGITREVTAPQANKGAEVALSAAGKGIKDVGEIVKDSAKLDDYLNKEKGKNEVYARMDPLQNQQIESLEGQSRVLGGDPGTAPLDILAEGKPAVPADLQGVYDQASKLQTAKETKAMNDTEYSARLWSMAKTLRSDNPGYRDYIDQQISKATGKDPANFRINSLNEQINALKAAVGDPQKKAIEFAYSHMDLDNMNTHLQAIMAGKPGAIERMQDDANRQLGHRSKTSEAIKGLELEEKTRGVVDEYNAGNVIDSSIGGKISNQIKADDTAAGHTSMKDALNWATDLESGKYTPEEIKTKTDAHVNYLTAKINQYRQEAIAEGQKDGGLLIRQAGGIQKYNARVDAALSQLVNVRQSYLDKDFGAATANERQVKHGQEAFAREMTEDPQYGRYWKALDYTKQFPDYMKELFKTGMNAATQKGMTERLYTPVENVKVRTLAPPEADNPAPVKKAVENIDKSTQLSPRDKALAARDILDHVSNAADPKMPREMKKNVLDNYFSAQSKGMLNVLGIDSAHTVYAQFGDPRLVRTAKDIGGSTWTNYQAYMKNEFSQVLFKPDIVALHSLGNLDPRLKISWDDKNHEWGLSFGKDVNINTKRGYDPFPEVDITSPMSSDKTNVLNDIRKSSEVINRLNDGIGGYSNVLKESGKSIDAELVSSMKEAGLGDVAYTGDNLLSHMSRALITMARSVGKGEGEAGDIVPFAKEIGEKHRRVGERIKRARSQEMPPIAGPE